MEPKAHRLERFGFDMWGVSMGAKLVGSYWTENAARTRIAELVRGMATASDGRPRGVQLALQPVSCGPEAVGAATLIASILDDMKAHRDARAPRISSDYESWKAKSSIAKLLDGDTNPEWEEREAAERDAEAAHWTKLVVERRASRAEA